MSSDPLQHAQMSIVRSARCAGYVPGNWQIAKPLNCCQLSPFSSPTHDALVPVCERHELLRVKTRQAGCQLQPPLGEYARHTEFEGSLHLDILRDNIADARQPLMCAHWAADVDKQVRDLGSPFISSGIGALDSLDFMSRSA